MKNTQNKYKKILIFITFLVLLATPGLAQDVSDLKSMSLEDLMNIRVTSVSKKPQRLLDAASAIYVITQEDIRRSGATNIPDALRRVPGIQVAHISANTWAITSRGLNGQFANKLLVLIDGRTVYTPLFSGVFWDVQDTLLEDIDRIEVIRGPGASLWGDNAVNGVINIITKKASDTQGGLLSTGYGDEQQGFASLRYGGKIGNSAHFRVYSKFFNRDNAVLASGEKANDRWDTLRGGFRIDWDVDNQDSLIVQGDIYDGETESNASTPILTSPFKESFNDESEFAGWNVLTRWKRVFSDSSNMELQLYFDRTERESAMFREDRDTFDFDFQHRFKFGERHDIVWGLGYRLNHDDIRNTFSLSFNPDDRYMSLYSGFVQDEITLIEDKLLLTVGSKISYNKFTDSEIQPNARLLWKLHERHSAWISLSRAVRTPSRAENDVRSNSMVSASVPFPSLVSTFGSDGFDAEELYAYELGYRFIPSDSLSVDIALYYNNYDKLLTVEPGAFAVETTPQPTHFLIPFIGRNEMDGEVFGVELAVDYRPVDWWHLKGSYSYQQVQMHLNRSSLDTVSESMEGATPHNQFFLRSSFNLPGNIELDLSPRYTDNLPSLKIDSYVELDARLSWKPLKDLDVSLIGQNLLDKHHPEYKQSLIAETGSSEIQRSVFVKIEWKF
ncbi:MAG: TonB-dependent receptor [Candidatus Scalindua sp.]|jgi:iron complex outermembrane receptor protein|nr:TonB-dependent receptor [Candidatus Scalindua sp.]MBT6048388.1 TonB-dependent receptor [Candidatus Scalindua sp.]MBT6226138.1 TonB-dependent receptor [Candidatus Scalindua sp.]MBT6561220.1 TonB-dependent receptor [Candidatus Scalindua sp.]MBT7210419.1 TonB-dependent receptor [Candidatus Scalindua sp.]